MGHFFDMLTFDFLLKLPQPFTGLFLDLREGGSLNKFKFDPVSLDLEYFYHV